ncbi:hypothetical protein SERLA73DRAFT_110751 [Serpula lacrymans var. lacrymans S7.3]|uniref:Uncharacterized protein n=1 Tax=Serpula lacrymans var. lacrymans (strain S7.3) TaxID=936435 RepID=F8Q2U1_SERL3|nr:hypothetical protein SERLA73DRAFT_110751 [Serpula lacrymans var. lacrymans S7.3]
MSANQQISPSTPAASTANGPTQHSTTWTEPPWSGWIETTGDALLILEAARRGLIPRVTRRLVDSERKMITSGSVFVFDEDESGIKRWTDGFFWSPSRILGNFLLYRETDKRGAGHRGVRSDLPPPEVIDHSQYNVDGVKLEGQTLSRPKGESSSMGLDRHRERTLVGSLTNSYKFKSDGLMKKTFSLTIGGVSQHLISYYKVEDVEQGRLRSPSSLPELASLDISPEYLDKTHFRNPPKVEIGVDGLPRYRGEADDIDTSPSLLTAPLSSGLPLLTDGRIPDSKRAKRFDPYAASSTKRSRKGKGTQPSSPPSPSETALPTPSTPAVPSSAMGGYHDQPPLPVLPPPPHYAPYPVANYYGMPGYAVPPPHVYSASPYPGASPGTPQQGSPPPPQQYPFAAAYPAQGSVDPQQLGQAQQQQQAQAYYPYYPPPHGHYPGYAGMPAWPHYAGYPPQAAVQPVPANVVSSGSAADDKEDDQLTGVEERDDA